MGGGGAVLWSPATCAGTPCRWEQELELVALLDRMYAVCSVVSGPPVWLFPHRNELLERSSTGTDQARQPAGDTRHLAAAAPAYQPVNPEPLLQHCVSRTE